MQYAALVVAAIAAPVLGHIAAGTGTAGITTATVTASITRTVTAYETYCPYPTTFTEGTKTFTATAAEWVAVYECPHKCVISYNPAYPTVLPLGEAPKYGNKTVSPDLPIVYYCPCPTEEGSEECPCEMKPKPVVPEKPCPEDEGEGEGECEVEGEDCYCYDDGEPEAPEPVILACPCPEGESEGEDCICYDEEESVAPKPVVPACPCPKGEENCPCDNKPAPVPIPGYVTPGAPGVSAPGAAGKPSGNGPAVVGGPNAAPAAPAGPNAHGPEVLTTSAASTLIPGALAGLFGLAAFIL